jgi:formylglycine-generating enzyme required for sulfatase activity
MKDLRELAKEYNQNVLDRESYRKSRRELIQGICAGEIEVEKHEYLFPIEDLPEEINETCENIITQLSYSATADSDATVPGRAGSAPVARPKPKASPAPSSAPRPRFIIRQKNIVIGMTIIILLSVITLTILLFPATDDSSIQITEVQVAEYNSGQILITDFIQQKNWSQDNMMSFVTSWQQLSKEELTAVQTSPEMKRLTSTIYQQLLDERAVLSLGDLSPGDIKNAVANQRSLVNFANQLEINDARLTVLEPVLEPGPQADTEADTEIVEIETETVIETTIEPEVEIIAEETTDETEEELLVADTETIDVVTEEPLDTASSVNGQNETSPTAITESPESEQEVPVQKDSTEPEETKKVVQKSTNKASCRTSLVKSRKPFCRDKIEGVGNGPTMVVIRNGKFTMGGKNSNEQPAHTVTISSPFAMSVHEISFGDYENFCVSTGSSCPKQPWSGKDYPVVNITHSGATSYATWLSEKTGQAYRLPSEAEWEYAARAGTKTEYPFGDEILITNAVFSDRKKLSAPLPKSDRSINRNKFRLYHTVGNVREWVADTWHDGYSGAPGDGSARIDSGGSEYVVRGGSYTDSADALRSGARNKSSSADNYTGFRVIQELSE